METGSKERINLEDIQLCKSPSMIMIGLQAFIPEGRDNVYGPEYTLLEDHLLGRE